MTHEYTGKTAVQAGQIVEVLDDEGDKWVRYMVQSALASQFTYVTLDEERHRGFCAYTDQGSTWREAKGERV